MINPHFTKRVYSILSKYSASFWILINSILFFVLSLISYYILPENSNLPLIIPLIYFTGSVLIFAHLIFLGLILAPVTWFLIGSAVFFGLGGAAGWLHVLPHSVYLFGDSVKHVVNVNLLNSSTVFLVLMVYVLLDVFFVSKNHPALPSKPFGGGFRSTTYWALALICFVSLVCKVFYFPFADSLLIRGVLTKLYFFTPAFIWLSVCLWKELHQHQKYFFALVFLTEFVLALLMFSKQHVISLVLAVLIGLGIKRVRAVYIAGFVAFCLTCYLQVSPVVTLGRAHMSYNPSKNTLAERFEILQDAIYTLTHPSEKMDIWNLTPAGEKVAKPISFEKQLSLIGRAKDFAIRFEVATIQEYLMREFARGAPGQSVKDFWVIFIPRVFWEGKPNVTRFGPELNADFFSVPGEVVRQNQSSSAPTFNGEAYWNYGPIGVVIISIMMGLMLSYFNFESRAAISGHRIGYFLIFYQVILWASNVEAWIVGSYLGEFVILVVMLNAFNFSFHFFRFFELKWQRVLEKKYELQKPKNH